MQDAADTRPDPTIAPDPAALAFLLEHQPARDNGTIPTPVLHEGVRLALQARQRFAQAGVAGQRAANGMRAPCVAGRCLEESELSGLVCG